MRLPTFPFVVLDTETTGVIPGSDKIIEIALIRYEGGSEVTRFSSLIASPEGIPPLTQAITRIVPTDLLGKPTLKEIWEEVDRRCRGAVVVGHNISFDIRMLEAEGYDLDDPPTLDTALLASLAFQEERSWSLEALSEKLHLPHTPPHRAMGDVEATAALFDRITERLQELPPTLLAEAVKLAVRGSPGMKMFFTSLRSHSPSEMLPLWTQGRTRPLSPSFKGTKETGGTKETEEEMRGTRVHILEIPLGFSPWEAVEGRPGDRRTWIAVWSARRTLERHGLPEGVSVLHAPSMLIDRRRFQSLQERPRLSDAEFLLALKGKWNTSPFRHDLAVYGEQGAISLGLLAATPESPEYTDQFQNLSPIVLLDHAHLLTLLQQDRLPRPSPEDHIVIAEASSFEDSVSHAYGHHIYTDFLRSGDSAEKHQQLTDLLEVFIQNVRGGQLCAPLLLQHLNLKEAGPLKRLLLEVLQQGVASPHIKSALRSLLAILDERYLPSAVTWVKVQPNGGQMLHSIPRDLPGLLQKDLFADHNVTLLSPPRGQEILAPLFSGPSPTVQPHAHSTVQPGASVTVETRTGTFHDFLKRKEIQGRTILLLPSRRVLEECFCTYLRPLEERGITLLVQGLGGSTARLEEEFTKEENTVLAVTAWSYEKMVLPPESADGLILDRLPFDHPGDIVLQERGRRFMNAFEEYQLPRLFARLYRILDAFALQAKPGAGIVVLDERMQRKRYGQQVTMFLAECRGLASIN